MRGSGGGDGAGIFIIIGPPAPASCPRPALAARTGTHIRKVLLPQDSSLYPVAMF